MISLNIKLHFHSYATKQNIQQIASLLDIPLSSTYRKIGKLEKHDIIRKTKVIKTLDGSDESTYTQVGFMK